MGLGDCGVVGVCADRQAGIELLREAGRQLGTVAQALIGQSPHQLEAHNRFLRRRQALVLGRHDDLGDPGAGPF